MSGSDASFRKKNKNLFESRMNVSRRIYDAWCTSEREEESGWAREAGTSGTAI